MEVTVADPATERQPDGWDRAAADRNMTSLWSWSILRTLAWSAPVPTVAVLISDPNTAARALFHVRLLGSPSALFRYRRQAPLVSVADCRLHPGGSLRGYLFAGSSAVDWRTQALDELRRTVDALCARGSVLAVRNIPVGDLPLFRSFPVVLAAGHDLVIENHWPDVAAYQVSVGRSQRSEVRRIRRRLGQIPDLRVDLGSRVCAVQAARLYSELLRRHRPAGWSFPALPVEYFDEIQGLGDVQVLSYHVGDRLLAFVLIHDDGNDLVLSIYGQGNDDGHGTRPGYYFDMLHRTTVELVGRGRRRLRMGKGMLMVKQRFGAQPQPTFIALSLATSDLNDRGGALPRLLEPLRRRQGR